MIIMGKNVEKKNKTAFTNRYNHGKAIKDEIRRARVYILHNAYRKFLHAIGERI